jgi:hypothetical protein
VHLDEDMGIAAAEAVHIFKVGMALEGSAVFEYDGGQMLMLWHWELLHEAQELSIDADIAMQHSREPDGVEPDA